jgi:hypothetical protein
MLFNFLHQIMHRLGEPGTAELFERMRQVADAESCEDLRRYVKEKMIAKH